MKLTKGFKWAIAAALSVATVAATVSIANAYTINPDTNSSDAINIISNSGGHFELAENDAIKQARSFTLNVDISNYTYFWGGTDPAKATLEYGSYASNGSEVKLGELVKNEAYSGDLTGTLSADDVASGKFWLRAADHAYASVTFHSISFFDESGNCILYGSADSGTYTSKWTFYRLESPSISVDGYANSDGSYVNSAEVSATGAMYPMTTLYYDGSNHNACTWGDDISHVLEKGGETLATDNIAFTEGGDNEYEYSAYTTITITDTMNGDKTVKLYSLPAKKTVTLTDKYYMSSPDEPIVVDDSELKATTFEQRTEEGIVSFANAWSGSPVLSGGLDLVSDTRPNCRIAKIVDRNEAGTGIQTYFVDVTYTDVEGFDPAVRAEQTVTLLGKADVSKLDVPNGYDNSVSVSDVKIASDYLTGVTLTPPTKTSYTYGETLDLTGGKLTLSYEQSADAEIPLTDSKVSVSGSVSSLGTNTITVTYNAAQGEAKQDADLTETFEVTVNPEQVADPVIAPASGTFTAPVEVTITTATSSAKIFYTTDGSEPTANSTFYEGAFTVSETATVKAIAVKEYWTDSDVASASYELVVSDPVIAPASGKFGAPVEVTITTATSGAKIYYTTDGTAPTANSTLYSGKFTVSDSSTVKAIAVKDNWTDSNVVSASYELAVADPVITPATSTFTSKLNVTITCATDGAKIYYTTDGSDPTNDSTLYEEAFTISATTTVKAIAVKDNWTASGVVTATYTKKSSSSGSTPSRGHSNRNTPTSTNPIINGKSQTWDEVADEIGKLPKGGTMVIDLNGNKSVPGNVVRAIADKKAVVTFKVSGKISVIINGSDIKTVPSAVYFSFGGSSTNLSDYHFDIVGGTAMEQMIIEDIGVPATLVLTLDKTCVSKFASIMKLNKTTGKMEFVGVAVVNADGTVALPLNGKGDYVIIVDTETKMPGDNDNDMKTTSKDAALVLRSIVFGEEIGFFSGDFDGNDSISAADASAILRSIIGL